MSLLHLSLCCESIEFYWDPTVSHFIHVKLNMRFMDVGWSSAGTLTGFHGSFLPKINPATVLTAAHIRNH